MKILALETSAKAVSAAIVEAGVLLAYGYQNTGLTHSRTLMPMVEGLFQNTELSLHDLDAIAVSIGPGSFTGIRIGVAAAKGLAFGLDKPTIGISTLEAMAWNVKHQDGLIFCVMDARRQQVYNAVFSAENGVLTRLTDDRAISLADLTTEWQSDPRPKTLVGDGAALCRAYWEQAGMDCRLAPPQLVMQNAASVGFAAEERLKQGAVQDAQSLQPLYLRPVHAQTLQERAQAAI